MRRFTQQPIVFVQLSKGRTRTRYEQYKHPRTSNDVNTCRRTHMDKGRPSTLASHCRPPTFICFFVKVAINHRSLFPSRGKGISSLSRPFKMFLLSLQRGKHLYELRVRSLGPLVIVTPLSLLAISVFTILARPPTRSLRFDRDAERNISPGDFSNVFLNSPLLNIRG